MRKVALLYILLSTLPILAQDHFSGLNTSQRVSIVNAQINPATLIKLKTKYEVGIFGISLNVGNNKLGISDLASDNLEDLIFSGSEAVNLRFDSEINFPSFAMRVDKWAFGIGIKSYAKLDLVDVDVIVGDALVNDNLSTVLKTTSVINNYNQRTYGTTWGEVALTAARNVFENDKHQFSAGATLKLLFPGSFANFGTDQLTGTFNKALGTNTLTNAQANLNFAYSGNLGDSFTEANDYSSSLFGSLNGASIDLGVNYQLKDADGKNYKINAGIAFRNMGSMTFHDNNNADTNYKFSITGNESLDLDLFDDAESLSDVEAILLNSGYLDKTENNNTNFKVKLPAVFSAYADFKVVPKFYVTLYAKQKLNDEKANDQITTQNVISLTPRFIYKSIEVWTPWANNEISGISGGLGFRAAGFYIGSGSAFTALFSDAKQADVYFGYSFGFR